MIGPQRPPTASAPDESDDDYAPMLPPGYVKPIAGPSRPSPLPAPTARPAYANDESDDEVGPRPPPAAGSSRADYDPEAEFRAREMREKERIAEVRQLVSCGSLRKSLRGRRLCNLARAAIKSSISRCDRMPSPRSCIAKTGCCDRRPSRRRCAISTLPSSKRAPSRPLRPRNRHRATRRCGPRRPSASPSARRSDRVQRASSTASRRGARQAQKGRECGRGQHGGGRGSRAEAAARCGDALAGRLVQRASTAWRAFLTRAESEQVDVAAGRAREDGEACRRRGARGDLGPCVRCASDKLTQQAIATSAWATS